MQIIIWFLVYSNFQNAKYFPILHSTPTLIYTHTHSHLYKHTHTHTHSPTRKYIICLKLEFYFLFYLFYLIGEGRGVGWGWGVGFEPPTKLSKQEVLTGTQFLERVAGKEERGDDLFQEVAIFR